MGGPLGCPGGRCGIGDRGRRAGTSGRRDVRRRLVDRPRPSFRSDVRCRALERDPRRAAAQGGGGANPRRAPYRARGHARPPRAFTFRGDSILGRHTRGSRRRERGARTGRPRDPEAAGRHARRSGRRGGRRPACAPGGSSRESAPSRWRRCSRALPDGPLRTAGAARDLAQERVATARAVRFIASRSLFSMPPAPA